MEGAFNDRKVTQNYTQVQFGGAIVGDVLHRMTEIDPPVRKQRAPGRHLCH